MLALSIGQVAQAYAKNKAGALGQPAPAAPPVTDAASFGEFMRASAASAVETLRAGEQAAVAGVQGKASAQQVVEAVMAAEVTLQSAIAIRDKMVQAYMDIIRMPV